MGIQFSECNPLLLTAIIIIGAIEIALIVTGNDGAYALPLVGTISLIIGIKLPEQQVNEAVAKIMSKDKKE
jgi:hypothetical protein